MGHHGEMAAVQRTESGKSVWGSIGIKWVFFRCLCFVIHVNQRNEMLTHDLSSDFLVREMEFSFTVIHMDPEDKLRHAIKHHGRTLYYLDRNPAGFKTARVVVNETRLPVGGKALPGDPAQEAEQLAAVADTKGKCILTSIN